jgi:hypothetical protein
MAEQDMGQDMNHRWNEVWVVASSDESPPSFMSLVHLLFSSASRLSL